MKWADLFLYETATGRLLWRATRPGRGCVAGREVGTTGHHGYRSVVVGGKRYYVHRIVWEMVHGALQEGLCVDHIDGDTANNVVTNLRAASLSDNQRNSRLHKNNRLGIQGIYPTRSGYQVRSGTRYVGHYEDFFEACCARKSAERADGFNSNHGRRAT